MATLGLLRYVYFRLEDLSGAPVTGRTQASFAIIFTRNDVASPDTLTVSEIGGGRYEAKYTPTTTGTDYLEIYDATTDSRMEDVEVIEIDGGSSGSSYVTLSQNYPTTGALTVTEVTSPQLYTLYVFLTSDWSVGRQATSYAQGQTALNPNGTWQSPIYVPSGIYTIVVISSTSVTVIASSLSV